MAQALIGVALRVLRFLPAILRANSFFINVVSKIRPKTILKYRDLKQLAETYKNSKEFANYLKRALFKNLGTIEYIFFSEKELREYIYKIDSQARILKVLETNDISLYIVEYSNDSYGVNWEGIFIKAFEYGLTQSILFTIFNNFYKSNMDYIKKIEQDILNKLQNDENSLKNDVSNILSYYKSLDINNTYCLSCHCCCSCEEGSCCCSCSCSLIHFIQSWDNAKNDIFNKIDSYFNDLKNYIDSNLYDEKNKNSLSYLFYTLMLSLFFNMKHKKKDRHLFAVLHTNRLYKDLKKMGVMKELYSYLKSKKGKWKYDELIKDIQAFLLRKFNKHYTEKQVITLLHTIKYRYMEQQIKIMKIDNKKYVVIE